MDEPPWIIPVSGETGQEETARNFDGTRIMSSPKQGKGNVICHSLQMIRSNVFLNLKKAKKTAALDRAMKRKMTTAEETESPLRTMTERESAEVFLRAEDSVSLQTGA
jgi:hypothetical protein